MYLAIGSTQSADAYISYISDCLHVEHPCIWLQARECSAASVARIDGQDQACTPPWCSRGGREGTRHTLRRAYANKKPHRLLADVSDRNELDEVMLAAASSG